MAKYLILYRSSVGPQEQMGTSNPEETQAALELWMAWSAKAGGAIADLGSPLAAVETVGGSGQLIGGFSVLEADSQEAVVALLEGHPHFHSPGDPGIEVLEFLPIPGL